MLMFQNAGLTFFHRFTYKFVSAISRTIDWMALPLPGPRHCWIQIVFQIIYCLYYSSLKECGACDLTEYLICFIWCKLYSKREDVYCVIKAFAARVERISTEAKHYTQFLVSSWSCFHIILFYVFLESLFCSLSVLYSVSSRFNFSDGF